MTRLGLGVVRPGLGLGVMGLGFGLRPGVGLGADALGVADIALGTLGSCSAVYTLAVGIASSGISVEASAVGVAALEVPVEELLANPLWAATLAIGPESSFTRALVAPAPAPALAFHGLLVIAKSNCYVCT